MPRKQNITPGKSGQGKATSDTGKSEETRALAIHSGLPPTEEGSFEWFAQHINQMNTLEACERYIEAAGRGLILMGQALRHIRDNRLYERDWKGKNFETYCQEKWRLGRWQVNNLIRASTACLIVKQKMGDQSPNFSPTVWGLFGSYLLEADERQISNSAVELVARYGEGVTVREAKRFLEEKKGGRAETESERLEGKEKERERERSKAQAIKEAKIMEDAESQKHLDSLDLQLDETSFEVLRNQIQKNWNQLLKQFGDKFSVDLIGEVLLKHTIKRMEDAQKTLDSLKVEGEGEGEGEEEEQDDTKE